MLVERELMDDSVENDAVEKNVAVRLAGTDHKFYKDILREPLPIHHVTYFTKEYFEGKVAEGVMPNLSTLDPKKCEALMMGNWGNEDKRG